MSGGAAVLEAIGAIAELGLPVRPLVGVVGATEKAIGGAARRPGDVLHALDGTTIEMVNTDAERRRVLADCLAYAPRREGAERLVDVATLTCGAVTALGFTYRRAVRQKGGLGRAAAGRGGAERRACMAAAAARGVRRADAQPDRDPVSSAEKRMPGHAGVPRDPRAAIVVAAVGAKFAPSAQTATGSSGVGMLVARQEREPSLVVSDGLLGRLAGESCAACALDVLRLVRSAGSSPG